MKREKGHQRTLYGCSSLLLTIQRQLCSTLGVVLMVFSKKDVRATHSLPLCEWVCEFMWMWDGFDTAKRMKRIFRFIIICSAMGMCLRLQKNLFWLQSEPALYHHHHNQVQVKKKGSPRFTLLQPSIKPSQQA